AAHSTRNSDRGASVFKRFCRAQQQPTSGTLRELRLTKFHAKMVMRADEMVDAALAGFDHGELITIPSLPDLADWERYEAARQNLIPKLSLSRSASRYQALAPELAKKLADGTHSPRRC